MTKKISSDQFAFDVLFGADDVNGRIIAEKIQEPFAMYTPEGNRACWQAWHRIERAVEAGELKRIQLGDAIRTAREWVEEAGHSEVWDTEARVGFVTLANRLCVNECWIGFNYWLEDDA